MENINVSELSKMTNKWNTAFHLSYAILDDYCETISKLTGESKEQIHKRVMDATTKAFESAKAELPPKTGPM